MSEGNEQPAFSRDAPLPPGRIDVLCVGHASWDVVLSVPHHPASDEKIVADAMVSCGGGPAANAAVTVARLGARAAFIGYLGRDAYGELHYDELEHAGVHCGAIVRGAAPTPLSVVLVKPGGDRALVSYRRNTRPLPAGSVDCRGFDAALLMLDGHEPLVSVSFARQCRVRGTPVVLDAGSVHAGTQALASLVDYLVCSETFAYDFTHERDPRMAAARLCQYAPMVVITLGSRGLFWKSAQGGHGALPAFVVDAVDTTGAGDVFHGAFAAGLATGMGWEATLHYASAAAALSCTRLGARFAIPTHEAVMDLLEHGEVRSGAASSA